MANSFEGRQLRLTTLYFVYLQQYYARTFINETTRHYNEYSLICLTGSMYIKTRRAAAQVPGFAGTYQTNDVLECLLQDHDQSVRLITENRLKLVWSRGGSEKQRQELYVVMCLIVTHECGEAVNNANVLLDEFPLYVESRNQRAIALFALKKFEKSIEDSRIVMDLNPYHFGTVIGKGHAHLQFYDKSQAIECFQHALHVNPNLETIHRHVECLTQSRKI